MVCPNCHSDQIIQVQDQHFCINCGQQVPEPAKKVPATGGLAIQENGLPEGVKILPVTASSKAEPVKTSDKAIPIKSEAPKSAPADPVTTPAGPSSPSSPVAALVKSRARIRTDAEVAKDESQDKSKRRKPGRPKAGRLDVPRSHDASSEPPVLPEAPKLAVVSPPTPEAVPSEPIQPPPPPSARSMSDISPRRPARFESQGETEPEVKSKKGKAKRKRKPLFAFSLPRHHRPHVHKVGIPPLHYGSVLAFSLRERIRPRALALAAFAAASFAAVAAYGVWLLLSGNLPNVASQLGRSGVGVLAEIALLAALYYIGRSVGQAAITYGVSREADHRPVPLARQIGVGINTFGRRLVLDLWFAAVEVLLISLVVTLVFVGGSAWPVDQNLQLAALFAAFLVLLYLQTAVAIARGLAGVTITLTSKSPSESAKLGWRLFSHRFELLGLRFFAVAMELVLALPLAAVAAALITSTPSSLHFAVALGVGVLAWVAGALFGAGTAAWWASLYRRIVMADRPDDAVNLLSSRQPLEARRGSLSVLVSLTTLLVAAVLVLPWLGFF